MTTLEQAARQALEALECHADIGVKADKQIAALRQALEQAENQWHEFVDRASALIKAADDAAVDGDYMLDSDDCISVLRGEWRGNFMNDHPKPAPPQSKPLREWQPIETAPKTGKKVILFYLNSSHMPRTVIARWLTDEQAAENDTDDVGLKCGWYECIDNWDDYTEIAIHEGEPSHWMPLPAPPIEAAHGIGEKK